MSFALSRATCSSNLILQGLSWANLRQESDHGLCSGKNASKWNPGAKSTRVGICLLFFSPWISLGWEL